MLKHPEQRVAVFIDTQNMYYSGRNLYNARVNFKNIVEDAVAGRKLIRAIAYVVATKSGEEKPFFDALKGAGIETKEKDLQIYAGGVKKADWDVGIAIDAVKLADKVDAIILVSGDGDFYPLLEYLSGVKGCLVEVMSFRETTSAKLFEVVDDFTDLSANQERYLMKVGEIMTTSVHSERVSPRDSRTKTPRGRPRRVASTELASTIYPIITPWNE